MYFYPSVSYTSRNVAKTKGHVLSIRTHKEKSSRSGTSRIPANRRASQINVLGSTLLSRGNVNAGRSEEHVFW